MFIAQRGRPTFGKSKFWLYALRACWERGEQTVYVSGSFVRFDSRRTKHALDAATRAASKGSGSGNGSIQSPRQ
jgi:hypothetical protein